ncbi:MAG: DUF4397 domain-containing protein [Chitinophagaceae bacterium]
MEKKFSAVRISLFSAVAVALLVVTSCKKSDNDNSDIPVAGLVALNLAPDISAGITLSGTNITAIPLGYTNYTGGYFRIYPGSREVQTFNANSGSSVASATYNFEQDKYYSLFVVGANNNYRNVITNDNFDSLSGSSNQAYIRYINAIPDSSHPAVTVTVNGSNVANANAAFASVSEFTAVTPGNVTISVTNGGNINSSRTITTEQRKVYTVLLLGNPASTASADSVHVRYITNGTLDETDAGRSSASSVRSN